MAKKKKTAKKAAPKKAPAKAAVEDKTPPAPVETEAKVAVADVAKVVAPAKAPKAAPAPKKTKAFKNADEGFASFASMAEKAWPGTTAIADVVLRTIPRISTGNLGLDIATYGGIPRGRIVRFFGREKSAKTGSSLNTVASWQKHCGICYDRGPCEHGLVSGEDRPKAAALWIDAENRLSDMMYWVEGHGIDLERLLILAPPSGQHIVDVTDAAIREHGSGLGLIVVDSVANMTSQEEIKKATMKGRTAPVNALLMNKALRKWVAAVNELGVVETKKPTIILLNQIRQTMDAFGSPETQPGGKGMDFATSVDVRFSHGKVHYLTEGPKGWEDQTTGFGKRWKPDPDATPDFVEIKYRVTASGICPNGRYGQFNYWLHPAHGRRIGDVDNVDRLWEYAKNYNLLAKGGKGWEIGALTERTQAALKESFFSDGTAQAEVWGFIVEKLIEV
jgi:RecA/RadA recombinase